MLTCDKNQICVLMVNSPNIPLYAHKAAINNYLYCIKYGHAFIIERCPDMKDLDKDYMWNKNDEYLLVWSKSVLVNRHLHNYKYLFIIDSDAIFIDFEKSIEYLINKYFTNDDICILASNDCYSKDLCWVSHNLNAGVMLFKNTPKTFEILNKWYNGTENECIEWKYRHPREQECINIIRQNYQNNILIIPYYEMNSIDGIFVKHYMLHSSEDRNSYISSYLTNNYKHIIEGEPYESKQIENFTNNIENYTSRIIIIIILLLIIFYKFIFQFHY